MSAFQMSEEFFNQLANELAGRVFSRDHALSGQVMYFLGLVRHYGYSRTFDEIEATATEKTQELLDANVKAVNQRYNESDVAGFVQPATGLIKWSDLQLYKHLQCLGYQMAEGDVLDSEIYKQLATLKSEVAESLVCRLPEYDQAKWDYQDATHEVVYA